MTIVEAGSVALDLELTQGDDFSLRFEFASGGSPVNKSTSTFLAQVRENEAASTSVAFSFDTTDAATGIIVMTMADALTTTLPAIGAWDLQEMIGTITKTLFAGSVKCAREVTRA